MLVVWTVHEEVFRFPAGALFTVTLAQFVSVVFEFGYILILSRKIKIRENLPQTFTRPSHCVLILDQCQLDARIPFFFTKKHTVLQIGIINMLSVKWSFTE